MVSPLGAEFADDGIEGFWIYAKHLLDHCRGVANNSSTGTGGGGEIRSGSTAGRRIWSPSFSAVTQLTSGQSRQETGPNTCDNTLTIVLPFFHCITPSLAGRNGRPICIVVLWDLPGRPEWPWFPRCVLISRLLGRFPRLSCHRPANRTPYRPRGGTDSTTLQVRAACTRRRSQPGASMLRWRGSSLAMSRGES